MSFGKKAPAPELLEHLKEEMLIRVTEKQMLQGSRLVQTRVGSYICFSCVAKVPSGDVGQHTCPKRKA